MHQIGILSIPFDNHDKLAKYYLSLNSFLLFEGSKVQLLRHLSPLFEVVPAVQLLLGDLDMLLLLIFSEFANLLLGFLFHAVTVEELYVLQQLILGLQFLILLNMVDGLRCILVWLRMLSCRIA